MQARISSIIEKAGRKTALVRHFVEGVGIQDHKAIFFGGQDHEKRKEKNHMFLHDDLVVLWGRRLFG